MLQDTDFFDRLAEWATFGDVHATIAWTEDPAPVELYTVQIAWRFRNKLIGSAQIVIHGRLNEDGKYNVRWEGIEFVPEWQNKKLYSLFLKHWIEDAPAYGIITMNGPPANKMAEAIYMSSGFEWDALGNFEIKLTGEKARQWLEYAKGNIEQPTWRHVILAKAGMLEAAEGI